MKITDLSAEDQALLNTEFPAELQKEAQAEVEKANDLYAVGFDKIASEMADDADKKEDEEKEEKKELSEEHKKEAAARGAFIARGVIDGLMKLGSERHGDELHYLYPAISEKLAMDMKKVKELASAAKAKMQSAASKAKASAQAAGSKAKEKAKEVKQMAHKHPGKAMAGAGALGGLAGYGFGRKKD